MTDNITIPKDAFVRQESTVSSTNIPQADSTSNLEKAITGQSLLSPKRDARFWAAWISLCLTIFVAATDSLIIAAALPHISTELGGTSNEAFWCATGFLLAQTVMMPLYGSLSDIFGRKPLILIALSIFFVASILCATAQNMPWLVGSRVMQGLGAGGLEILVVILSTDLFSLHERGKFGGMIAAAWALGCVAGVVLGGVFSNSNWRWIFWINIPLCIIPFCGIFFFLNLTPPNTQSFRARLLDIDWLGTGVFVVSTTIFIVGLTSGGVMFPWKSAGTIVPLVLGAVGLMIFVYIEYAVATNPMAPLRIFSKRTAATGYVTVLFHGLIVWSVFYEIVIYFTGAIQHSTLHSAIDLLPAASLTAPFAGAAGFIVFLTKRFKYISVFAWVVITISLGLLSLLTPHSSPGMYYGFQAVFALGSGILFSSTQFAIQVEQADDDAAIASTFFTFSRSFGQAIGVAIGSVVFQNTFDTKVAALKLAKEYVVSGHEAEAVGRVLEMLPVELRAVYAGVYADAVRALWYVLIPIAALGVGFSLMAKNLNLDRKTTSKQQFTR